MIIEDLRNADISDLGNSPGSVRYTIFIVMLILILVAGYFLFIGDKRDELEQERKQELSLRNDFEYKQQKAPTGSSLTQGDGSFPYKPATRAIRN